MTMGIQWNAIAENAKSSGFESIRITGFDCNALDRASSAATTQRLTILPGIFYTVIPLLQHLYLGWLTLLIEDRCL